jgi:ATP phosphoribosyltransferase
MLKFVIPKGSLEARTLALLEQADLTVRRSSDRDYHGTIDDPRIDRVSVLRPQEIPRYIEEGFFDIGITGQDWVAETGAKVQEVATLGDAGRAGGIVRIVLAVPNDNPAERLADLKPGGRVSTEYPNITQQAFDAAGIPVTVFLSYGATEAKVPEIVDSVVEATETGSTLRRSGLKIIETLLESRTCLIANPVTYADPIKRAAISDLVMLLQGALSARGRVLVKLNVARADLDRVLEVLPAMKSPTISELSSGDAFAVETVVDKSKINTLIPTLKERGASDIVELPISKIVP